MNVQKRRNAQFSDPVGAAVDHIDRLIADGQLLPGQRLVEADLSEQLKIGRGPIREALRILAGDGVVELMPNRGARVRSFTGREMAEMIKALVGLLCIGVEEFVGGPAYASGMQRLRAVLAGYPALIRAGDGFGLLDAMARYQQTVFEAAGNAYLVELHRRVHFHHYNRQMLTTLGLDHLRRTAEVYGRVTRALEARNAVLASALLKTAVAEIVEVVGALDELPIAQRA